MKKFLLYILLPGVVLGVVYNMGRNSGVRSAMESTPALVKNVPSARLANSSSSPVKPPVPRSTTSPPAKTKVSKPVSSLPQPVVKPVIETLDVDLPEDLEVQSIREVPVMRGPDGKILRSSDGRIVESTAMSGVVKPVTYSSSYLPATNVPSPAPIQSIYDRRSVPAKASELGAVPLSPLQPLEPAVVYPGSQPVRTTFKEPVLAPTFPQSSSPIRITLSTECDCGKEH
jgi:hypothetical protein